MFSSSVNMSENQVNILKDAIRLKKGATLCFPTGYASQRVILPKRSCPATHPSADQSIGQGTGTGETCADSHQC